MQENNVAEKPGYSVPPAPSLVRMMRNDLRAMKRRRAYRRAHNPSLWDVFVTKFQSLLNCNKPRRRHKPQPVSWDVRWPALAAIVQMVQRPGPKRNFFQMVRDDLNPLLGPRRPRRERDAEKREAKRIKDEKAKAKRERAEQIAAEKELAQKEKIAAKLAKKEHAKKERAEKLAAKKAQAEKRAAEKVQAKKKSKDFHLGKSSPTWIEKIRKALHFGLRDKKTEKAQKSVNDGKQEPQATQPVVAEPVEQKGQGETVVSSMPTQKVEENTTPVVKGKIRELAPDFSKLGDAETVIAVLDPIVDSLRFKPQMTDIEMGEMSLMCRLINAYGAEDKNLGYVNNLFVRDKFQLQVARALAERLKGTGLNIPMKERLIQNSVDSQKRIIKWRETLENKNRYRVQQIVSAVNVSLESGKVVQKEVMPVPQNGMSR